MELATLLEKFDGQLLDQSNVSNYEHFALNYYPNQDLVLDPFLSTTIQLDITAAKQCYEAQFAQLDGATFTAYLTWHLLQSLNVHQQFNFRYIDEQWFHFQNLPLFFTVATNDAERYRSIYLYDLAECPIEEFFLKYKFGVRPSGKAKSFTVSDQDVYQLANFIGNLPNLQFTSFSVTKHKQNYMRPIFFFGRRYQENSIDKMPLFVQFSHASSDPVTLDLLLSDFSARISGVVVDQAAQLALVV